MEDKDRLKETYDQLLAYIKERFELLRLDIAERSAREASGLASKLVLAVLLVIGIFFLSITLALYLGQMWGSYGHGFAAVGGGFIFLFLIVALLRRSLIQRPLMNGILKNIFKGGSDE
jgi:hypothetical protein